MLCCCAAVVVVATLGGLKVCVQHQCKSLLHYALYHEYLCTVCLTDLVQLGML
jgi:hypothetical protein